MSKKEIIVNTRKEFIDLFRSNFIPYNNEKYGSWGFSDSTGYALNKWTSFWYWEGLGR